MMKYFVLLFFTATIMSCKSDEKIDTGPAYTLEDIGEGVMVESFEDSVKDENRFNYNNKVFQVGCEFVYNFVYQKAGEPFHFRMKKQGWEFIKEGSSDSSAISSVRIKVLPARNMMSERTPGYNQTVLSYKMPPYLPFSMSGVIENEANVWMHPPRSALFEVLELNPFPYVKLPLEVGNTWDWSLSIGDHWSDDRWKSWKGTIENKYLYEVTDKKEVDSPWGKLECYEISSAASSRLGNTHLTALYHEEYGFVKMEYTNIDGSCINFELAEKNCVIEKQNRPLFSENDQ